MTIAAATPGQAVAQTYSAPHAYDQRPIGYYYYSPGGYYYYYGPLLPGGYYPPPLPSYGSPPVPAVAEGAPAPKPSSGPDYLPQATPSGSYYAPPHSAAGLPREEQPESKQTAEPPQFLRQLVAYATTEPAGTIIIDTAHTSLYLVLGQGKALRYGIGVGRSGFTWSGTERISRMSKWLDWHPPNQMIARQPYLPRFTAGGEGNPMGSRALYLGDTEYRIHGTNQPATIGQFVSSGCIRLTNEDVEDLYTRVGIGTRVVVLPGSPPVSASAQVSR